MANSVVQHKVQGVLRSLDRLLFDLHVHNNRVKALSEEIEPMCKSRQDIICHAIKKYADHNLETEPETNDHIQNLRKYVADLQQANSNLQAEIQKWQEQDDVINRLCNAMVQNINDLNGQETGNNRKFDADGTKQLDPLLDDDSDKGQPRTKKPRK